MNDPSAAILSRFLALHPKKIDLSLGRIQDLLAKLGHPELRLPPVIHVAGTNGKGSTIAFMRGILEAAGKSVHVYTSPHLVRFHERIRIGQKGGGKFVSEEALATAFAECERANAGAPITVFEITTAAALKLFSENPADYLLLEVGLGGRYDATNVIDKPAAAVITPVSFDHPEFLGATVTKIAGEKAGIIKRDCPVIVGYQSDEAFAVVEREAQRQRAPMLVAGQDFATREERGRLVYEDEKGLLDLPLPKLLGRHQIQNVAAAIATLRTVAPDLPASAYEQGVTRASWPARLQRLARGRLFDIAPDGAELWLDGGHNEAGGQVLAAAMADFEERAPRPLAMICGTLATKDTAAFLRPFKGLVAQMYSVPIAGEHAARTAQDVTEAARTAGLDAEPCESVLDALRKIAAREWSVPPRILIAGSLYLAGEVLATNGTLPD
jgi:dihydrofolate synthase/folylpolyglutamate synthase